MIWFLCNEFLWPQFPSLLLLKVKQASTYLHWQRNGLGSVHSCRTDWALNELLIIHNYRRCKKPIWKAKTWGFFHINTNLWFFSGHGSESKATPAFTNWSQRMFQHRIWEKLLEPFWEYINCSNQSISSVQCNNQLLNTFSGRTVTLASGSGFLWSTNCHIIAGARCFMVEKILCHFFIVWWKVL